MLGGDDIPAAGDGAEDIADLCSLGHGHDLVAVHDSLECAHGVCFRDDDLCAQALCAQRNALAAPAVAGDDDIFARNDEIGRAADAVPHRLTRAVAVIKHVLAVGVVDHDHWELEFPFS